MSHYKRSRDQEKLQSISDMNTTNPSALLSNKKWPFKTPWYRTMGKLGSFRKGCLSLHIYLNIKVKKNYISVYKNHARYGTTESLKSEKKKKKKCITINCKKFEDDGINGGEKNKKNWKKWETVRHDAKNVGPGAKNVQHGAKICSMAPKI